MIKSMTGYGRSQQRIGQWEITAEIKAVNHRYFEFSCRIPRSCNYMEDKLKSLLQSGISRGKTDLYLQIASAGESSNETVKANIGLAMSYLEAMKLLSEQTGLPMDVSLSSLSRYPEVLTSEKAEIDEDELWAAVSQVVGAALEGFVCMRLAEGQKLYDDISSRLDTVLRLTAEIEEQSPQTVEAYRNRLYQKLSALLADRSIDDARVLTEAAIFADRVAVDEETVRLKSHVSQFREIMKSAEPVGRKLDFLTQELNREANTIGSKAQASKILSVVVELKSELEKIREQIQNIE